MDRHARYALGIASAIACSTFTAFPKDIFVSSDPNWKMPGLEGETYTDLQTALNHGLGGDTIWLQDGYVCDSGKYSGAINGQAGYARGQVQRAAMTVRSESGYVDEKNGKGATIRGAKDPESTYADGRGDNAIRPLWVLHSGTVVMGLILENGAGADYAQTGGGGAYCSGGTFSNCVFRNNSAYAGGAVNGATALYNCVITNNSAFGAGYGGGAIIGGASVYDCLIADNKAEVGSGGAIFYSNSSATVIPVYSNCVFRHNTAKYNGVANFNKARGYRVRFYDCDFHDNTATAHRCSGIAGVTYSERCRFWNNVATNSYPNTPQDGGCISYNVDMYGNNVPVDLDMAPVLVDCLVSNNFTCTSGGGGSGIIATNCTIIGNEARGIGGGANKAILVNCDVIGNVATNNYTEFGNGGGLANSTATNCRIVGNAARCIYKANGGSGGGVYNTALYNCIVSNNYARYRGAAIHNVDTTRTLDCYNCLIADNRSGVTEAVGYDYGMIIEGRGGNTRRAVQPKLYNCTIAGNTTGLYAIMDDVELINCIVWGNTAPGGDFYDCNRPHTPIYTVTASYTCQKNLTAGENGNVNTDPRLTADYHLSSLKPCMNAGQPYAWMTDPTDVRSKDLDGKPRLLGAAPDMGCYERTAPGLAVSVR